MVQVAQNIHNLLAELHSELQNLYGARLVKLVLYGSHARGEATPDSDVDVMVVLKAPVNSPSEILSMADITTELSLKYQELISILPISDVDFSHKQTPLLYFVRQQGLSA
jgi:predicted nucleotidyltransferase